MKKRWVDMDRAELLVELASWRSDVHALKTKLVRKDGAQITKDIAECIAYKVLEKIIKELVITTGNEVVNAIADMVQDNVNADQVLFIVEAMNDDLVNRVYIENCSIKNPSDAAQVLIKTAHAVVNDAALDFLKDILMNDLNMTIHQLHHLRKCQYCNETYNTENEGTLKKEADGFDCCHSCYGARVTECENCGDLTKVDDLINAGGVMLCPNCYETWAEDCEIEDE